MPCWIDSIRAFGRVTANLIMLEVYSGQREIKHIEENSCLIRRQLEVVSLVGDQVAEFHGEHASPIGDDQGKIPELEINIVSALEVVVHRNLLFSVGVTVFQLEDGILGMTTLSACLPGELLDRVDLVVYRIVRSMIKFSQSFRLTISLASMLDSELELGHLSEQLEVLSLGPLALLISGRLDEITEDGVGQLAVAITAKVTSSLVDILGGPKGTIGYIDIDCQASAWLTNRGFWLCTYQCCV
jgi:hypothetical protein